MRPDNPNTTPDGEAERAEFGRRLLAAFDAIADLPPIEREAALEALRIESPELERAVRALLARDAETGPLDATLSGQIQPLLREALPELDPAPAQIGPYQVLRLLGEGGMGRVYLARRSEGPVARDVAIKLIRPDRAGAGLLARFEAERRHLAALDHPGICRFIDADSLADGTPYVVMEVVQGEPIIDYCQRHALGLRARVELLRKLLAAVAHAHDRLLLHRDIKPHNVLVTADGQPKLLDFGIAKSIEDAQASVTRTAERFFTPNASAPEQLLGEPAGVACDVYSLGALAYELLSGTLPFDFEGLRAAEIERLILQVAPPLMSERSVHPWARELRGDLDAIVATCLRKSPGERYRNVDALDAELQRWQEGRPVTARAPSWTYRSRLFIRRHRTAVGLSAALILAIAAFGSGLVLQAIELREQRNLAVVERDRALQVVEILESAFRNADPGQSSGDKVTARQILDAAAPGIETLERGNPAVFVRMTATLARVEMDLAQNARSIGWVRRGIAINDTYEVGDEDSLRDLLTTGAMLLARSGDVDEADSYLRRLKSIGGGNTAEYHLAYARNLVPKGERRKALEMLAVVEQLLGERAEDATHLRASEIRWLKATCLRGLGRAPEAVALLQATLDWQLSQLTPQHPWALRTRTQLFSALADVEPSEELVSEHLSLIEDLADRYGEDSIEVGINRGSLGAALLKLSRYAESAAQYANALRISTGRRGKDHLQTLILALNYANALALAGDADSRRTAVAVLEQTSEILKLKVGRSAPIRGRARMQLANLHMDIGNLQGAAQVLSDPDEPDFSEISNLSVRRGLLQAATRLHQVAECAPRGSSEEAFCVRIKETIDRQQ